MSLWKIAWRSIQQRALASWLTGLSMALGVALVAIVLVLYGVVSQSFSEAAQGYHLIVGAKGGKLQLVLNTVFHLSQPIENIPYSYYQEFTGREVDGKHVPGKYSSKVAVAVPYCLGDSYEGFRVVGTTPDLFEKLSYGSDGTKPLSYRCSSGKFFTREQWFGAVVGSVAAHQAKLAVGEKFAITHGVPDEGDAHVHEDRKFIVTGVLEPTGTPNDRAIFVNLEGFYLLDDHAKPVEEGTTSGHDHHDHDHPEHAKPDAKSADHADHKHEEHENHEHPKGEADHQHEADHKHETDHKHEADLAVKAKGVDPHDDDHKQESDHEHEADDEKEEDHKHRAESKGEHDHDHDHDHSHDHGSEELKPLPVEQREVTSLLLLLKSDTDAMSLFRKINKGNVAQAVYPTREVAYLFEGVVGNIRWILLILAVLVVVVSGIGVMVSIYNSMSDRSREIAVMRSLGASRATVMMVVLVEAILLAVLGGLAGVVLAHGAIGALGPFIVRQTGVSVGMFQFDPYELVLIPGIIVLAALVGYLPALAAYRTDVAKALSSAP